MDEYMLQPQGETQSHKKVKCSRNMAQHIGVPTGKAEVLSAILESHLVEEKN